MGTETTPRGKKPSPLLERPSRARAPELDLLGRTDTQAADATPHAISPLDLSGKPKIILLVGMGQVGKSTLARYIIETAKSPLALASVAPNQTLATYHPGVVQPDDLSVGGSKAFLEQLIDVLTERPQDILIDFPGGDGSLLAVLEEIPDLLALLEEAGLAVVCLCPFSAREEDLVPLAQLTAAGFTPRATALVLNAGRVPDPTRPPLPQFDRVTDHSVFRAAEERGAMRVLMPRLYCAQAIEDRRLLFREAAGAVPAAKKELGLGITDRMKAAAWQRGMATNLAPIAGWLP